MTIDELAALHRRWVEIDKLIYGPDCPEALMLAKHVLNAALGSAHVAGLPPWDHRYGPWDADEIARVVSQLKPAVDMIEALLAQSMPKSEAAK